MKPEDLKTENVGRKVLIDAIGPFENCCATLRGWTWCRGTAYVSLDGPYGKGFQTGTLVEVKIENLRFAPSDRVTPIPGLGSK